jgi:hypothetical protein
VQVPLLARGPHEVSMARRSSRGRRSPKLIVAVGPAGLARRRIAIPNSIASASTAARRPRPEGNTTVGNLADLPRRRTPAGLRTTHDGRQGS